MSLRPMAQAYRLGLLTGVFHKEDVVAWADRIVAKYPAKDIPSSLLDISLASKRTTGDIVQMLGEVQGEYDAGQATKIVLGELRRRYSTELSSVGEITSKLYALANASGELDISVFRDIMTVTEAYDLAVKRIVSMQQTLALLDEFFAPYQKYENVLLESRSCS